MIQQNNIEIQYINLVQNILENGFLKTNRTGTSAYTIPHVMLQHDLRLGFPLLTTKKVPFRLIAVETELFLKGITDKKWLQDRNCHIWDEWCNPQKVPYGTDEESKRKMKEEKDLGLIYGFQWRNFNSQHIDQLKNMIDTLKTDPSNRRLIVSAWNPAQLNQMALPPCHILFHVTVINNKLNLCWFQRSCDTMLGVPFNIASYALITHLIAKETHLEPAILTGFLSDVHIYEPHKSNALKQIQRIPHSLPTLELPNFSTIDKWSFDQCKIVNYDPYDSINYQIVV